jgi:pyruvate dehydrogenase E2 component (dihydrolipoamide acetyltransferase)
MAEAYTVVALSPLRKVIAARMTEATRTIPHFRLVADLEIDALLAWRAQLNVEHPDNKVSINDCLIKACASALMGQPTVNIQLIGEEIHQYHQADISVVMAVEGGLLTPVVRGADRKGVLDIATEVKAFAVRAAGGRLRLDEMLGGSFSISNLGGYGVEQFDAIINLPQCAILAVGRAKAAMTVDERATARIATLLRVTLSLDHRAIDGATGAAFLATLRQTLQHPEGLLSESPK